MAAGKKAVKNRTEKIVFLDAATVDYGDLPLQTFRRFGTFKTFSWSSPAETGPRSAGATILMTNKCPLKRVLLARLSKLKLIVLAATGTNNVDLRAAKESGIAVTNVSGYSTENVVQFTFAFLLSLAGNLVKFNEAVHGGRWSKSPIFTLSNFSIREIHGKTLGIVGYGTIGKRVARIAKVFGMKVLIARIPGRNYGKDSARRTPFGILLKQSDFVTLHAPLSGLTHHLMNQRTLSRMKKGACLINMARGGLVEEKALDQALRSGHLAGAASDVLSAEPPPADHLLLKSPNLLLTPHVAWASLEARKRLVLEMRLNIQAFLQGKKRNRVV